jgi:PleD family two-component response regulator
MIERDLRLAFAVQELATMSQSAISDLPTEILPRGCGSAKTILVVEDDSRVRKATCEMLRDLRYSVLSAEDAEHARPQFAEHAVSTSM